MPKIRTRSGANNEACHNDKILFAAQRKKLNQKINPIPNEQHEIAQQQGLPQSANPIGPNAVDGRENDLGQRIGGNNRAEKAFIHGGVKLKANLEKL